VPRHERGKRVQVSRSNHEFVPGGTIETALFLSVSGSHVSLFIQWWTGRKGEQSTPLPQGIFHYETSGLFGSHLT
jgi:hypothetical protein